MECALVVAADFVAHRTSWAGQSSNAGGSRLEAWHCAIILRVLGGRLKPSKLAVSRRGRGD